MGIKIGKIELNKGVMTGGKSSRLVEVYNKVKKKKRAYKPKVDNRFGEGTITTHDGKSIPAKPVNSVQEILVDVFNENYEFIIIDEVQFFNKKRNDGTYDIINLLNILRSINKNVIIAGLDRDFRGEWFGPMEEVESISDQVNEHKSICAICRDEATLTQRLVNGEPAYYNDPVVLVGSTKENKHQEKYEPRCFVCHEVKPGSRI